MKKVTEDSRYARAAIRFDKAFRSPPVVHLSLSNLHMGNETYIRYTLLALDITAVGFTLELSTWHDTEIFQAIVLWTAIGQ